MTLDALVEGAVPKTAAREIGGKEIGGLERLALIREARSYFQMVLDAIAAESFKRAEAVGLQGALDSSARERGREREREREGEQRSRETTPGVERVRHELRGGPRNVNKERRKEPLTERGEGR
jgi:hypothetical protein